MLSFKVYGNSIASVNSKGLNNDTALHIASRLGYLKVCEILIDSEEFIDINAKNNDKNTPLHLACINGHCLVAQLLIRFGGVINVKNKEKNTPLHCAVNSRNLELIEYLFSKFPENEEKNAENLTAQGLAAIKNIKIYKNQGSLESCNKNKDFSKFTSKNISFSDFEIVKLLGKGSFAEVFLVKMVQTGQLYAMKVLCKEKVLSQGLNKYV